MICYTPETQHCKSTILQFKKKMPVMILQSLGGIQTHLGLLVRYASKEVA